MWVIIAIGRRQSNTNQINQNYLSNLALFRAIRCSYYLAVAAQVVQAKSLGRNYSDEQKFVHIIHHGV